ncbi:glycosyltransferase [Neoroseomonas oryzicola]|uniref:Glycosyltransferase family 4 protein n=1 Tax=Neoroseomonas oryzicola TaxID=535904 RepID=A0A9X9WHU0_9PROT|nr:glycosyltransferase [Neoroseomonas oryzicola]MBR0659900.1 glycosyltransferase family 4 protein [Neoroseomonas oryzicola]NKE15660.1 glycosyltransferase family 4 protein [Neoroseomonas oryzicola]
MNAWHTSLKPMLAQAYSRTCAAALDLAIARQAATRSFHRVAVVAALGRRNGISSGAVLQFEMLRRLGFEAELIDAGPALRNPLFRVRHAPASTYVVHCGAPQTPQLLAAVMPAAASAWRIGYWAWELPDPPDDWFGYDRLVNEVWTPSRFAQASLRRLTDRQIGVVPHVVPARERRRRDPSQPFTVLCFGDSRSSFARKNPAGAIAAFQAAFGESGAARLIVKLNGAADPDCAVERAAAGLPNVTILRDFLDEAALDALYRSADVLLSLHRAEGFGLPMLEAMARGVPVVGTGWSGNVDFMDSSNAVLVPARLVPVEDDAGIYRDSVWAEPDLLTASAALRGLAEDASRWERLSCAAHAAAASLARHVPAALAQQAERRGQIRAMVAARIAGTAWPRGRDARGAANARDVVQGEHG